MMCSAAVTPGLSSAQQWDVDARQSGQAYSKDWPDHGAVETQQVVPPVARTFQLLKEVQDVLHCEYNCGLRQKLNWKDPCVVDSTRDVHRIARGNGIPLGMGMKSII